MSSSDVRWKDYTKPPPVGAGASSGMSKTEWRDFVKLKRGCIDCGYKENPFVLDFDHRPGEKKLFTIGGPAFSNKSWASIELEIAKCDVRCANCHRIMTKTRKAVPH
jgi:hypothetical protein